jgi:hypothetical protein
MVKKLQTLSQDERWVRFEKLNKEITDIMRKEIGTNKNIAPLTGRITRREHGK